jgi:hypothetical protein
MSKIKVNEVENRTGSTLTLGKSGTTIQMACGATQTGFGRTGTVDWCTTAKTSPLTGVSGNGYFINTTGGAVTVTLPASPSAGDIIAVKDYTGTAGTNKITIARNGSKIRSACACIALEQNNAGTQLIYVDGTEGWQYFNCGSDGDIEGNYTVATGGTITESGDYKIHTFTSSSDFVVSNVGNSLGGGDKVSYMVAAGGGGGSRAAGGGGGAGGFREGKCTSDPYTASPLAGSGLSVSAATFPITVGAGGTAGGSSPSIGGSGGNSIFSSITSTGGGGANFNSPYPTGQGDGVPGGSGGGGGHRASNPAQTDGGSGNTPPVSPPQGNNGGAGSAVDNTGSGGGGGATAAGATGGVGAPTPGTCGKGGNGGAGATTVITGSPTAYAGGGGGGSGSPRSCGATGGTGGGGNGGFGPNTNATAGGTNTGGGGGGAGYCSSSTGQAAGGSGVVIIRYKFKN